MLIFLSGNQLRIKDFTEVVLPRYYGTVAQRGQHYQQNLTQQLKQIHI